ncbi:hypothetical protein TB2_006723 [Malus domestica]
MDSQFFEFPDFSSQQSQFSSQVSEQIDVEASGSKKKVIRGAGFNKDEDHVLISGWLNTSMDTIIGNDQKHQTYWQRIEEYYNQNKWFESNRTGQMLSQQWQKIQKEVNRFSASLATLYEHNQSGATQQGMIANALATYEALHQKKFNLDHAWVVLRRQPKWLQVVEFLKKNSTSQTLVEVEQDNIDTEKRPLGNKAAKRKMKEAAKNDSTPISVRIQKLHEEKKEREERKMDLIKKKVEHGDQKIRLKRLDFETKIMSMDTSEMGDEERLYYSQLKMKILRGDDY